MHQAELDIKIAQAIGWKFKKVAPNGTVRQPWQSPDKTYHPMVPNFSGNLNAMHKAENSLPDEEYGVFIHVLKLMYLEKTHGRTSDGSISAAAHERAVAFLKVKEQTALG